MKEDGECMVQFCVPWLRAFWSWSRRRVLVFWNASQTYKALHVTTTQLDVSSIMLKCVSECASNLFRQVGALVEPALFPFSFPTLALFPLVLPYFAHALALFPLSHTLAILFLYTAELLPYSSCT